MVRPASAVVYASDVGRLQRFYEAVCGLTVVESEPTFVTLTSDAWELHLVAIPARIAATIEVTAPSARRTETPIKLVFEVPELPAARAAATAAGGVIDGPEREWTFHGAVVGDGHDPEGNVIQLRVPPQN